MRPSFLIVTVILCILAGADHSSGAVEPAGFLIRGVVVDEAGRPVTGAVVTVRPSAAKDTTDDAGSFRIGGIQAGPHAVEVSMPWLGLRDARVEITVPLPGDGSVRLVMQERTFDAGEIVAVSPPVVPHGEETPGTGMAAVIGYDDFTGKIRTVADVVAEAPGAVVRSTGGYGDYTEVSLRGSDARQVQVYLDGMLLNEAMGGAVNLADVPLSQARSIEVWRSGAPARFGGGAAGGVVNIRTHDTLSPERSVSLGLGSFGTTDARALYQIPFGSSRLLLSGGYTSSENDFRFKSDNGTVFNSDDDYWTVRKNDAFRSGNILARYRTVIGDSYMLELSEHLIANGKELPGRDIVQDSHARLDTSKSLAQAKLTAGGLLGGLVEIEPILSHLFTSEHYRDTGGTVGWGVQDNFYRTNAFRFSLPASLAIARRGTLTVTAGAGTESFRPDFRLQKTIPLSCDRTQFTGVIDLSLRFFGEKLVLSGNSSRERLRSTFDGQPSPLNRVTPGPAVASPAGTHAGIRVTPNGAVTLSANWSDVTRAPGFFELFGDRGTTVSNPNLRPESVIRRDIGIRTGMEKRAFGFSLETAYFWHRNRNLIQWYANDAGFLYPDNVAGSWVRGTELTWTGRLGPLAFSGNRTFQSSRVTDDKSRIYRDKQLPNRPAEYGTMKGELRLPGVRVWWSIDRRGTYFLDRVNQSDKRYPGRTLHDIGASVPIHGRNILCTLEARNIGNVHTFDTQGMPLPGRSLGLTFGWTGGGAR